MLLCACSILFYLILISAYTVHQRGREREREREGERERVMEEW